MSLDEPALTGGVLVDGCRRGAVAVRYGWTLLFRLSNELVEEGDRIVLALSGLLSRCSTFLLLALSARILDRGVDERSGVLHTCASPVLVDMLLRSESLWWVRIERDCFILVVVVVIFEDSKL